jgi:hypothetical protein
MSQRLIRREKMFKHIMRMLGFHKCEQCGRWYRKSPILSPGLKYLELCSLSCAADYTWFVFGVDLEEVTVEEVELTDLNNEDR